MQFLLAIGPAFTFGSPAFPQDDEPVQQLFATPTAAAAPAAAAGNDNNDGSTTTITTTNQLQHPANATNQLQPPGAVPRQPRWARAWQLVEPLLRQHGPSTQAQLCNASHELAVLVKGSNGKMMSKLVEEGLVVARTEHGGKRRTFYLPEQM